MTFSSYCREPITHRRRHLSNYYNKWSLLWVIENFRFMPKIKIYVNDI